VHDEVADDDGPADADHLHAAGPVPGVVARGGQRDRGDGEGRRGRGGSGHERAEPSEVGPRHDGRGQRAAGEHLREAGVGHVVEPVGVGAEVPQDGGVGVREQPHDDHDARTPPPGAAAR
jgi:hypothetical protein